MKDIKNNLKFDEVEKRLADLDESILENNIEINNKISEVDLKVQSNTQKTGEIEEKTNEANSLASEAKNTADNAQSSISNLTTQVKNFNQQLDNCNQQIQTCNNQISSTASIANQNKKDIELLQLEQSSINQELSSTNQELSSTKQDLASTKTKVDNIETELSTAKSSIETLESSLSNTNSKVKNIEDNLSDTSSNVKDLEESLLNTNSKVATLENGLSTTNTNVENLDQQVSSIQTKVDNNTKNISTNSTSINGVNRELEVISGVLDNYSTTLDQALSWAGENQTKINAVDKYATSLNSKITENTSKISEVEQKANIQPDWSENDSQSLAYIKNKPEIPTNNAKKEEGVFFVEGLTSSQAGDWQGTNNRISSYYDGLIINFKVGVAGSSNGTTLNLNSLGAKPCYLRGTTKVTTHYAVGTMLILCYNASTDAFYTSDYDANNYAYVRQYGNISTNANYPMLFSQNATVPATYATNYAASQSGFTYNPSTKTMAVDNLNAKTISENGTNISNKYATIDSLNSTNTSLTEKAAKLETLESNVESIESNYVTTNTTQEITSDKTIKGRAYFKNFVDVYDSSISGYPTNYFRLQTYGGKFFLTYQNNIAVDDPDAWRGTAFEITESTGVTDFKKLPTVNGVELATKTDVEENGNVVVDSELSSTSSNPVQNKVILSRLTSMSQEHNLLKTDVDLMWQDVNSNKTNVSSLQTQMNNAGLSINQNAININSLTTAVNGRAKSDLSNVTYPANTPGTTTIGAGDRVVNTYISSDGKTFARLWASGWKEMGGSVSPTGGWQTITLPASFSNTNYKIVTGYTKVAENNVMIGIKINNKTTSNFRLAMVWVNGGSQGYCDGPDNADWYACGY